MYIQLKVINTFFPFINCSNLGMRTMLYKHIEIRTMSRTNSKSLWWFSNR